MAIAGIATLLARRLWPGYAVAEPDKAYDIAMLAGRLAVGALSVTGGAGAATAVARDDGQAALWLGVLALAVSLPIHLVSVWADYPAWYHMLYLGYLVPIAGLVGRRCAAIARDAIRQPG